MAEVEDESAEEEENLKVDESEKEKGVVWRWVIMVYGRGIGWQWREESAIGAILQTCAVREESEEVDEFGLGTEKSATLRLDEHQN